MFKKIIYIYGASMIFYVLVAWKPSNENKNINIKDSIVTKDSIKQFEMIVAGDVMQHLIQVRAVYDDRSQAYNYDTCFAFVKPIIENANLSVTNLETTLAGKPFSGYPAFSSPDALAYSLKKSGFDVLLTANNHCLDRGKKGLERTLSVLDEMNILHTGTYKNLKNRSQQNPLYVDKDGFTFSFLNYTYGTNGIKSTEPNIVNYIDTTLIAFDLKEAAKQNSDFTVVFMHWGVEYKNEHNKEQEAIARYCYEKGADLIIGMHPHVIQEVETISYIYENKPKQGLVYYSLGNFVSNQRARYKDGGIMAKIKFSKNINSKSVSIADYSYIPTWVYRQELPDDTNFYILPAKNYNEYIRIFKMSEIDKQKFSGFIDDTRMILKGVKEE